MHDHINSFPRMESHYCRATSKKEYLEDRISVKKMQRIFKNKQDQENKASISYKNYLKIFKSRNLGFHVPKKDLCDFCQTYINSPEDVRTARLVEYIHHRAQVEVLRDKMKTARADAIDDKRITVAVFDLQKVLLTPKLYNSSYYYSRKLRVYNFTVYDMAKKEGTCMVWNESVGNRGANEIASGLYRFMLQKITAGTKEFKFFSDSCGGQNKNRIIFAMYARIAWEHNVTITQT